ncbi:MAG: hypothetical protein AAB524_01105 [Patescibacteria group bacterium]
MKAFLRFSNGEPNLSASEKKIVQKLSEAATIISTLYLVQRDPRYPGANFYPHDATREEIERASKQNPSILSPYTFVERDKAGKLVAVPYSKRFKKELVQIAKLLREAASLSKDKEFRAYLVTRAQDLLRDKFDKSNILWLNTEQSKIGFVIGPFDRYIDKLFFRKRAYMAWIGILDPLQTDELSRFKDTILLSERNYLPGAKRAKIAKVKIRVEDTLVFSGLIADFLFVGNNIPSSADLYLIKKYGTLFTLFNQPTDWRFSNWLFPIFQRIFSRKIKGKFTEEELKHAFLQTNVLHEACHTLMRYEDAQARLRELTPYFDELFTDLLGVKGCGTLILKNALTERELEAILIMTICHSLYFYTSIPVRPHLNPYALGGALIIDFLVKGKALRKQVDGFSLDSYRAFMALNQLTSIVEYYVALGNHQEAEEFLKKFSLRKIFSPFDPYLKGIPKETLPSLTRAKNNVR